MANELLSMDYNTGLGQLAFLFVNPNNDGKLNTLNTKDVNDLKEYSWIANIVLHGDKAQKFMDDYAKFCKDNKLPLKKKRPYKIFKDEPERIEAFTSTGIQIDTDKNAIVVTATTKAYRPAKGELVRNKPPFLFDADATPLVYPEDGDIGNGSTGIIFGTFKEYLAGGGGVTYYLKGVQFKTIKLYSSSNLITVTPLSDEDDEII